MTGCRCENVKKKEKEMIVTTWKLPCWQWCSTRKPNASPILTAGSNSGSTNKASHNRTASAVSSVYNLHMKDKKLKTSTITKNVSLGRNMSSILTCVHGQTSWLEWFYAAGQPVLLPVAQLKSPLLSRGTWKPQSKHLEPFHSSGNHQSPPSQWSTRRNSFIFQLNIFSSKRIYSSLCKLAIVKNPYTVSPNIHFTYCTKNNTTENIHNYLKYVFFQDYSLLKL